MGLKLSPESSAERQYYKDVVLTERLNAAVKRINPWINESNLRNITREFTHPKFATLMEANQSVWETLVNYQSVFKILAKGQTVKVIDFENPENNEFLCTNQFKIEGPNQNIIPDIVLFVKVCRLLSSNASLPTSPTRWKPVSISCCGMPTVGNHTKMKGLKSCSSTTK